MKDPTHLGPSPSAHSSSYSPACLACPALPGGPPAEAAAECGRAAGRRPRHPALRREAVAALHAGVTLMSGLIAGHLPVRSQGAATGPPKYTRTHTPFFWGGAALHARVVMMLSVDTGQWALWRPTLPFSESSVCKFQNSIVTFPTLVWTGRSEESFRGNLVPWGRKSIKCRGYLNCKIAF